MVFDSSSGNGEQVVMICNEHWVKYLVTVTIAFFLFSIALLLFLLAGLSAHHAMWLSHATYLAALLLFLLTFHWIFILLLSESLERIIVTNRRLLRVHYHLITQEDILEVSFEKMKTVDACKEGFLQNILHYGTLRFEINKAAISLVPHPNRIARVIQQVMQSV